MYEICLVMTTLIWNIQPFSPAKKDRLCGNPMPLMQIANSLYVVGRGYACRSWEDSIPALQSASGPKGDSEIYANISKP